MRTNRWNRSIFVSLFLLLVLVGLSGCSMSAKKMTQAPVGLSATPGRTATEIGTPQPDTTPDPGPVYGLPRIASLGKGVINGVFPSPDGKQLYSILNSQLLIYDPLTLQQTRTIPLFQPRGDMYFSRDGKLAAFPTNFSAEIVDIARRTSLGIIQTDGFSGFSYFVFSPNGKYIAFREINWTTGGPYQLIDIFDISSGKVPEDEKAHVLPFRYYNEQYTISPPAISPDSQWVAAGSSDTRVYLWKAKDFSIDKTLEGHGAPVTSVDFSPDGRFLASGSEDGTVRLWNPATGSQVRTLTGFLDGIEKVAFSPDGKLLKVSVKGQPDQAWDMNAAQLRADAAADVPAAPGALTLELHRQGYADDAPLHLAQYSPDGKMLAVASRHVQLWNATSHKLIRVLEGKDRTLRGLAFRSDGGALAAVDQGGNILVWDTRTGELIQDIHSEIETGGTVLFVFGTSPEVGLTPAIGGITLAENGLAFSPDGTELAFANGGSIEVWKVAEGKKHLSLPTNLPGSAATSVAFSPDGERLYAVLNRNRSIQVWDPGTGHLLRQIDTPSLDPNAFTAVALQGDQFAKNDCEDQTCWIEIWDLKSGASKKLPVASGENEPLRFSPDGRLLVTSNADRLYFWKTETGQLVDISGKQDWQDVSPGRLSGLATNPEGNTLALSYGTRTDLLDIRHITARIDSASIPRVVIPTPDEPRNDFPTPEPKPTQAVTPVPTAAEPTLALPEDAISPQNAAQVVETGHFGQGTIERLDWSPDGKQIAVAGSQGIFRYDAGMLKEIDHLDSGPSGWAYHSIFLPDGRLLATLVSTSSTGPRVAVVNEASGQTVAQADGTGQPAIRPDGNRLVFANQDGDLLTWDVASNRQVALLHSYAGSARYPLFSPDGQLAAGIETGGRNKRGDFVRVWNAETGVIVNALAGPDSEITDLSFSADGQYLVGAAGGSAWIWPVDPDHAPEQLSLFKPEIKENTVRYQHTVTAAAINPGGSILAVGTSDHALLLYERQSQRLIRKLSGHTNAVARVQFSPDGTRLVSADQDGNLIVWNMASGVRLAVLRNGYTGRLQGLTFREDGNFTAWSGNTAWTVRPGDGKLVQSTSIATGKILSASPDGKWLGVYDPFKMYLYNAFSGQKVFTLEGEAQERYANPTWFRDPVRQFYAAAFSANSRYLAAVGTGGTWVYNLRDGRLIRQEEGNDGHFVAVSSDGREVWTCPYDSCPREAPVRAVTYSPDGRWSGSVGMGWKKPAFLSVSGPNGQKTLAFSQEQQLTSLAFNPNSTLVAVGQEDGKVFLVDTGTLQIVKELPAHPGEAIALAFSKDGRFLASAGQDGVVRFWSINREGAKNAKEKH